MNNWAEKYYLHGTDNYIGKLNAVSAREKAAAVGPTGKMLNHADDADAIAGSAGDFIDSWLKAIDKINVYDKPSGSVKAIFYPGEIIGKISSYVVNGGYVWWIIEDPQGNHYGYVRHVPGTTTPEGGWGEQDQEDRERLDKMQEESDIFKPFKTLGEGFGDLVSGIGEGLGNLGGSLKWVVIAVIVGLLLYSFFYAKKSLA